MNGSRRVLPPGTACTKKTARRDASPSSTQWRANGKRVACEDAGPDRPRLFSIGCQPERAQAWPSTPLVRAPIQRGGSPLPHIPSCSSLHIHTHTHTHTHARTCASRHSSPLSTSLSRALPPSLSLFLSLSPSPPHPLSVTHTRTIGRSMGWRRSSGTGRGRRHLGLWRELVVAPLRVQLVVAGLRRLSVESHQLPPTVRHLGHLARGDERSTERSGLPRVHTRRELACGTRGSHDGNVQCMWPP